jgi:3-deoxy-manno-octulosonate cytidylyltransferase (CMP-KDO synthetase)
MKFLGIIPARFGSTRLKGKPLADICGKSMIERVYERAIQSLPDLYVATDDDRVFKEVERFGGKAILTSADHNSGTNRCLEAYRIIQTGTNTNFDVIINVQGDEPLLEPFQIEELKNCFDGKMPGIATLVAGVNNPMDLENNSEVFVVLSHEFEAMYFSRSIIPHLKGEPKTNWMQKHRYYKHIGMYAYTPEALEIFARLPQSSLELAEGLEQNRWLENGYTIKVGITDFSSICVDTPEDLERVRKIIREKELKIS